MEKADNKDVKEIKKLIDLPPHTVKELQIKAKANRMDVKNYMEKVLIDHAANPFKK